MSFGLHSHYRPCDYFYVCLGLKFAALSFYLFFLMIHLLVSIFDTMSLTLFNNCDVLLVSILYNFDRFHFSVYIFASFENITITDIKIYHIIFIMFNFMYVFKCLYIIYSTYMAWLNCLVMEIINHSSNSNDEGPSSSSFSAVAWEVAGALSSVISLFF